MSLTERSRLLEALIRAGRRLDALGLVPARDGNLSARLGEDRVLVTATGTRKRELTPPDFVEVDLAGGVHGPGVPSTELGLHLAIYRARSDVRAIVHAHPPVAIAFTCAGRGLEAPLLPEAVVSLGPVPLVPYTTPGTPAVEAAVTPVLGGHQAFLLAHHGAVTLGGSIEEGVDRMETLEHLARITFAVQLLGGASPLPPGETESLLRLLRPR